LKITLICVGKIKEEYLRQGVGGYLKRLQIYAQTKVIEVADESSPEGLNFKQKKQVLQKEGERILEKIPKDSFVFCLDLNGRQLASEEFARKFNSLTVGRESSWTFIIGGSMGLYEEIKSRANFNLALSQMTFPHQLARLILLEQIYRAFRILRNEPYHK